MRRRGVSPKDSAGRRNCSGQCGDNGWGRTAADSMFALMRCTARFSAFSRSRSEAEYVVQAHHAGGSQMVAEGAPRAALEHIRELLTNYRMDTHGNLALMYGAHDPGCCSLGMRALSLMMLGDIEQAEAASSASLDLSQRLDHKPSISHTHMFRAEFCIIMNRADDAEAHLRASMSIARKFSLAGYIAADDIMQGLVSALRGDPETGVRQAEAALESLRGISVPAVPLADPDRNCRKSQSSGGRRRRGLFTFTSPRSRPRRPPANAGTSRNFFA